MSNVKPGDLARVARDPEGYKILGMQVLVIKEAEPHNLFDFLHLLNAFKHGLTPWDCQALESREVDVDCNPLIQAGETYAIPDEWLKRIDPPADGEELWRDTPIASEQEQVKGWKPKEPQRA